MNDLLGSLASGKTKHLLLVTVLMSIVSSVATAQVPETLPFQNPGLTVEQRARDLVSRLTLQEKIAQMQHRAPAISRLSIPAYDWWSECLHGVARNGIATVFPQAIGMAATWDPAIVRQEADVISTEARAKHHDDARKDKRNT